MGFMAIIHHLVFYSKFFGRWTLLPSSGRKVYSSEPNCSVVPDIKTNWRQDVWNKNGISSFQELCDISFVYWRFRGWYTMSYWFNLIDIIHIIRFLFIWKFWGLCFGVGWPSIHFIMHGCRPKASCVCVCGVWSVLSWMYNKWAVYSTNSKLGGFGSVASAGKRGL